MESLPSKGGDSLEQSRTLKASLDIAQKTIIQGSLDVLQVNIPSFELSISLVCRLLRKVDVDKFPDIYRLVSKDRYPLSHYSI